MLQYHEAPGTLGTFGFLHSEKGKVKPDVAAGMPSRREDKAVTILLGDSAVAPNQPDTSSEASPQTDEACRQGEVTGQD